MGRRAGGRGAGVVAKEGQGGEGAWGGRGRGGYGGKEGEDKDGTLSRVIATALI